MQPTITARLSCLILTLLISGVAATRPAKTAEPWKRHVIDGSHRGADGVRLGDFNNDGLPDVVTGWEESGLVRLYVNPGAQHCKSAWPVATIASSASPEDAVPIDVDGDGQLDIISCHEGKQRQLLVHWNNVDPSRLDVASLLDPSNWSTDRFKPLDGVMWMFAVSLGTIDSRIAIVAGAKGPGATMTLLLSPIRSGPDKVSRDLSQWTVIPLREVGWIMSLRAVDMDSDGDKDIVFSDRKGDRRVAAWLEQPDDPTAPWIEHAIAGQAMEVMFLSVSADRCLISTRENQSLDCRRTGDRWQVTSIPNPDGVVNGKAIESFPDGSIILTSNTHSSPNPDLPGIWRRDSAGTWSAIDPTTRVKFDRMELVDLDRDGDLDVMTCEERRNLGVIWYENPAR